MICTFETENNEINEGNPTNFIVLWVIIVVSYRQVVSRRNQKNINRYSYNKSHVG